MDQSARSPDEVHDFWFGGPLDDPAFAKARCAVWFKTDFDFDRRVAEGFATTLAWAAEGRLDAWADTPRGALALIIVLDQFSRNIHRGTPAAFATDERAQAVSTAALEMGLERDLAVIEQVFFYMPFEHAEDLALQELCVAGYRRLHAEAPPAWQAITAEFIDAGVSHRDVISRFGRFPHRNPILERPSTPAEIAWSEGHHGWGQGATILARKHAR